MAIYELNQQELKRVSGGLYDPDGIRKNIDSNNFIKKLVQLEIDKVIHPQQISFKL